jgi:hypothetical protein
MVCRACLAKMVFVSMVALVLANCSRTPAHAKERLVGLWEDCRIVTRPCERLAFHPDGSIRGDRGTGGTYALMPNSEHVLLAFALPESTTLTLTLAYDPAMNTDLLVIHPEDIPTESALMKMFTKVKNGE